ncbi:MAG: helix-turn-helix transcriptional regulator [Dehalococcoidales bacterium]|nr:helix-turn-helix transcriptional regulator [Dehalococcoidales bacterium]
MKTLKRIRHEHALAIRDLAEMAGVSPNTVVRVEAGMTARPSTRRKIARCLKLKPQDIQW